MGMPTLRFRPHQPWLGILLFSGLMGCHRPPAALPTKAPDPAGSTTAAGTANGPQAAPNQPAGLAARIRIGGFTGLRTRSRIEFSSQPDQPHQLLASLCFPDLARLELSVDGGGSSGRVLTFRFGERVFEVAPGTSASNEPDREVSQEQVRRMELRRAAFLWPDGFDWEEREGSRYARLPDVLGPLGFLVASEFNAELPTRIDVHRPSGDLQEALRIEAWQTLGTRRFPQRLLVQFGTELVWTETVERIETNVLFRDALFLPADRLELLPATQRITEGAVPSAKVFSLPLIGQRTWERALEMDSGQRNALAATLPAGQSLEPGLIFDLAADGLPAGLQLRWVGAADAIPPPGLIEAPAGESLRVEVESLSAIGPAELETLRALLPDGSQVLAFQALRGTDGRVHVRMTYR
jgi:hypothetical protein